MFTTGLSQKFTIVDKCNIVNFKRIKKFSKSTSNFNKINFVIKTYRLDSYFFSYYPYIGSNGESAHLGLLLYEFMRCNQSKIHPCNTVLSFWQFCITYIQLTKKIKIFNQEPVFMPFIFWICVRTFLSRHKNDFYNN